MTRPGKSPKGKTGIEPGSAALEADTLATRPYEAVKRDRSGRQEELKYKYEDGVCFRGRVLVCWLLNVPATG